MNFLCQGGTVKSINDGDELIYGTPAHPSGANLWRSLSDAEAAYGILAQDGNFAEGHFVDKASDAEAEALERRFR